MKKSLILMTLLIIPSLLITQALAQTSTQNQNQPIQSTAPGSAEVSGPAPAPATAPATAGEQPATDQQKDIHQKIESLQKQLDTLKEQGRTREKLTVTAEEKAEQEKTVLTAVGREYTLMQKGKYELEYSLRYEYRSSSEILDASRVEPRANQTIRNAIGVQYGLLNNLTVNANIPFVYTYDKTGSSNSKSVTDLGDVTVGLDYQPFKSGGKWPATTIAISAILPTGRSPYAIDRDREIPTGSGLYGLSLGVNMSKSIDPAMAFGGISYTYRLKRNDLNQSMRGGIMEGVDPGQSFNAAIGLAYSISYALSMNTQIQYGYNMSTTYSFTNGAMMITPAYSTGSFVLGAGWRFSVKTTLSVSLGIGLTKDDPDFFFLFRLPFSF